MSSRRRVAALALLAAAAAALGAAPASAETQNIRFTASDGVELQTTLSADGAIASRPVLVEFSPYGRGSATLDPGSAYNRLLVQIRGTGDSDGSFDALGPRTQADVAEVLDWACDQPWSNGKLAINGFSASAITIYNSLHLKLPCVEAAVLKSGTHELYRDLLVPGGVNNLVPGTGVLLLIGAPALFQGPDRLVRDPASGLLILAGLIGSGLEEISHPTLDSWWRERGMRGNVNDIPTLVIDGFFDVESRGAFQGFRALRKDGAHLMVIGAHDGAPADTDGGTGKAVDWLDHFVRDVDNGVERQPRVQLWLADGDREDLLAGRYVRKSGSRWPLRRTRWRPLALDAAKSGSSHSLNDGTLTLGTASAAGEQSYPAVPSLPTNTDPYNTAIIGGFGINALTTTFPALGESQLSEPLGLTYTTAPLAKPVLSAGPASAELRLASTAPSTAIWAVISDVWPDGSAHPVAAGRLLSDFPGVDEKRSLKDRKGTIVQPYGTYGDPQPAAPGESRLYRVELWPIGNRFAAGHRIRLEIVGSSAASVPGAPAINTVSVGGDSGSRLLFPVLRGSGLGAALGG